MLISLNEGTSDENIEMGQMDDHQNNDDDLMMTDMTTTNDNQHIGDDNSSQGSGDDVSIASTGRFATNVCHPLHH